MKKPASAEVTPETFQGWSKLEPVEQTKLTVETQALDKAADSYEMSNLEVGEHLDRISQLLTPKRQFNKWLIWWLGRRKKAKSRSWAYQALEEFKTIRSHMPKPVLEMAKERGTKIDARILALNPPPKTNDKGQIAAYLDTVRPIRGRIEVAKSRAMLVKECVNFVGLRWAQVPNKEKPKFKEEFLGMCLTKFGVSNSQYVDPIALPDTRAKKAA